MPSARGGSSDTRSPLATWHLLSLDAPSVAVVWTWFTARLARIELPWAMYLSMAIAVWALYAADRLLDTRRLPSGAGSGSASSEHEARHLFHHRHRLAFLAGISFAAGALIELVPRLALPCLHLYLVEALPLGGYLLAVHARSPRTAQESPDPQPRRLPKEFLVGPFFAAATFIPSIAHNSTQLLPLALIFAGVCSLNCLFIYRWEHLPLDRGQTITSFAARHLAPLGGILIACALLFATPPFSPAAFAPFRPYPVACAASIALLFALDRLRAQLSRTTLRAAADAALLTPLLLLPFLS